MHRARRLRQFPAPRRRQNASSKGGTPRTYDAFPYVVAAPAATLMAKRSGALLLGRWKWRALRTPIEQRSQQQHRIRKGGEQLAPNGVGVRSIRFDAEFELLRLGWGDIGRSEHPSPQRQAASQVLVEVRRVARMVDLVMRRAHEQMAEPAGERYPKLRMLQMNIEIDEKHQDDVVLRQQILMRRQPKDVIAETVRGTDEQRQNIEEDAHIDRVHAEVRQRRQHRRRMMPLWNSQRNGMRCDR